MIGWMNDNPALGPIESTLHVIASELKLIREALQAMAEPKSADKPFGGSAREKAEPAANPARAEAKG